MSEPLTLEGLKRQLDEQKSYIARLEKTMEGAVRRAEAAEAYSRQDCLILGGSKRYPLIRLLRQGVPLRDEVIRLIKDFTGIHVPHWCVNVAHWSQYERTIIVRFNNKEIRNQVYFHRVSKDENKRGRLLIHESLTKSQSMLLERLKALKRNDAVQSFWTQHGSVMVKGCDKAIPLKVLPHWSDSEILEKLASQPESFKRAAELRARTVHAQVQYDVPLPSGQDKMNHVSSAELEAAAPMVQATQPPGTDERKQTQARYSDSEDQDDDASGATSNPNVDDHEAAGGTDESEAGSSEQQPEKIKKKKGEQLEVSTRSDELSETESAPMKEVKKARHEQINTRSRCEGVTLPLEVAEEKTPQGSNRRNETPKVSKSKKKKKRRL